MDPEELIEEGNDVLALVRYRLRGAGRGIDIEQLVAHLLRVQDGRIRAWWMFGDADKTRRRSLAGDRPRRALGKSSRRDEEGRKVNDDLNVINVPSVLYPPEKAGSGRSSRGLKRRVRVIPRHHQPRQRREYSAWNRWLSPWSMHPLPVGLSNGERV
jgi:hypothetical protein